MNMKNVLIKCALLTVFIIPASVSVANAQSAEVSFFNRLSIGFEYGTWEPIKLRNSDDPLKLSIKGENAYAGISVIAPLHGQLHLRLSLTRFQHSEEPQANKTLTLYPALFDLKYSLVSESKLSPYVSYGVMVSFGRDNEASEVSIDRELGYGLNLGTGFDLLLLEHLALGVEFRYHYLKYNNTYVFTDDYSGPKINLGLLFLL